MQIGIDSFAAAFDDAGLAAVGRLTWDLVIPVKLC